jgi:hypothetical protein
MVESENFPKSDESQVTEISEEQVRDVHAQAINMHQAGAQTISASEIEMEQSAAAAVKATNVTAHQAALGAVEATQVLSEQSLIGAVQAEKASISGFTGAVVAGTAEIHYSLAGVVVGNEVHVADQTRTVLLVSRNVQGNVTTLMDTRSALIAGLLGGLFGGMMLLLGRMLFKR